MGKGVAVRWTEAQLTEHHQRKVNLLRGPLKDLHDLLAPVRETLKSLTPQTAESGAFYALGRMAKGKMNKTETRYAQLLDAKKHDGEILDWKFHVFRLRLADNTFYEPDFLVLGAGGQIEIHETKGSYTTDKGQLKVKLAAEVLPWFRVFKCSWLAKEKRWNIQEFNK